jgi:flagellar FliL protein
MPMNAVRQTKRIARRAADLASLILLLVLPGLVAHAAYELNTPLRAYTRAIPPQTGVVYYDFPSLSVNLNTPEQPVLDLKIILELDGAASESAVESAMPILIDSVQTCLHDLQPANFHGAEARTRVRQTLLDKINGAIKPVKVNNLLFREVVIR